MALADREFLVPAWRTAVARLCRCDPADVPHIRQVLAIPLAVFRRNLVGLADVAVAGALWHPDPEGSVAFITPAYAFGRLVDLVAWHPASPLAWATRLGIADHLGRPDWQRCRVRRSTFGWLVEECDGVVALEPGAIRDLCPTPETLVAEDEAHRRELIRTLTAPADLPRVVAA